MDAIEIYLKNYPCAESRRYLSEDELRISFSWLHKFYYGVARPLIPLVMRHWLQRRYASRIRERANFIWGDFVELLKSDEAAWHHFVHSLYPSGYETSIILTHDVETQKGYDFIPSVIELEHRYGFHSSWNLVAHKYRLHSEIIDVIKATGNEIGVHGYNHDGTDYYSERRFSQRAVPVNEALHRLGAVGFRSPQVHRNLRWLQRLDILYDASCFDYDPYQPFPGGTGSIWPFMAGKFVELPYTLPQDHVLFYLLGRKDIDIWKEKAKWVGANHGMILALTHPDYLMEEDCMRRYEELLAYLKSIPRAWHCLPREMAYWYKNLSRGHDRSRPRSAKVLDNAAA